MGKGGGHRTVTALRSAGAARVAVDLDGATWRVLPAEVVARSGLTVGTALDRPLARRLAGELRRFEALSVALTALRHRDHSRRSLAARFETRRIRPAATIEVLEVLERTGLVDDGRAARDRAAVLAERDAGDLLIRDDLERRGFSSERIEAALADLPPERDRVERIVAAHGSSPKTLRRLAARGFGAEALESLVADATANELG